MTKIKEARLLVGMSQAQVCRELGIPRRTLQDWEYGTNNPPPYVEKLVIDKLLERIKYCEIRWETEADCVQNKERHGFSCWVIDPDEPEKGLQFYWFVECNEVGKVSNQIVWKIQRLLNMGFKIKFVW